MCSGERNSGPAFCFTKPLWYLHAIAMLGLILLFGSQRSKAFTAGPLRSRQGWSHQDCTVVASFRQSNKPTRCPLLSKGDDNDDEKDSSGAANKFLDEEGKDLFVFENMRIFDKVSQAVTATAWGFLAVGFLLNVFGYDFLVKDGKLTVDTLEARQFEKEVNRVVKSPRQSSPSATVNNE